MRFLSRLRRSAVDGTVVAWGHNDAGELDVPDGLTDVVAIAAGGSGSIFFREKSRSEERRIHCRLGASNGRAENIPGSSQSPLRRRRRRPCSLHIALLRFILVISACSLDISPSVGAEIILSQKVC